MRPVTGSEAFQPRSRKSSLAEPIALPSPRSASPVTFFLRRGSRGNESSSSMGVIPGQGASSLHTTAGTVDNPTRSALTATARNETDEAVQSQRRRSTLKAKDTTVSPGSPSTKVNAQSSQQEPLTPLLVPSDNSSLSSSPKSTSTRSLRPLESEFASRSTGNQAILSSGDEGAELESSLHLAEETPQLIMPSIKIPSRRPFTERGKRIGNFKILVAGSKGVGKTSLVKSIVQTCEDIVHVDPLAIGRSLSLKSPSDGKRGFDSPEQPRVCEINASTRPYPSWWSEIEDSKILRRRSTSGDTVLDRNLCFVDTTASHNDCSTIYEYMMIQLQKAMRAPSRVDSDLASLLGGKGGSQVDVVLYMLSQGEKLPIEDLAVTFLTAADTLDADIVQMKALSELGNVVPLISKADQLSSEHIEALKVETRSKFDIAVLPRLPAFGASDPPNGTQDVSAPYTVSSASGPDHETMDASLLMSPDYVQPLVPSELAFLIQQIFETDVMSYLRHSAARKLIAWQAAHPNHDKPTNSALPPSLFSPRPCSLAQPLSFSNPGVLVPFASDRSLSTTSNTQAMIRLAEHAQQEERLAQARLNRWASDLQNSLQRERERFDKLARGERAIWLIERISEEARDGRLSAYDNSGAMVKAGMREDRASSWASAKYPAHDPLGLLRWSDKVKTRGWIALQVVGSFGIVGGLALWLAKTWGLTSTINDWTQGWSWNSLGMGGNDAGPIFV